MYLLVQVQGRIPCLCSCHGLVEDSKGALKSSWQAWNMVSASSTLVSALIVLAGDLVRPWIHLSNGCTCWSRCSMESLANCWYQAFVGDSKGALRSCWRAWMRGDHEVGGCGCVDHVGGVFGLPQESLEIRLYMLV